MRTTTLKNLLQNDDNLAINKVLIPKIQRAYAQGRMDSHATKTRKRFLGAIQEAIRTEKKLTLDFIYGHVEDGCLIPLDGQQRLTTLWLLHWFAREKEKIKFENLNRFTYHTRYSARDFLKRLTDYHPDLSKPLSEQINNQGWFPMDWINDPTVAGMLTMLDLIQQEFGDIEGLWEKLDLVNFYFLSIPEMNLTDEIYIKMNSRGKPLTEFEHFKAEFLKTIRTSYPTTEQGDATAKRIGIKIDTEWTDLLWPYRDANNIIDYAFMRYFLLITYVITYKLGQSATELKELDYFDLLKKIYRDKPSNIEYFEATLDGWVRIKKTLTEKNPEIGIPLDVLFEDFLCYEHTPNKVVTLDHSDIHLMRTCVESFPQVQIRYTYFIALFYAFLFWIEKQDIVTEKDFRRRLRIVVNLIKNSSNEVVDNPKGDAGNRMPAILRQIEGIVQSGNVDTAMSLDGISTPNFSVSQLMEERLKLAFTYAQPDFAPALFKLEDHPLIAGRTQIVGFENTDLYGKFIHLFDSEKFERDAVDCALLSLGDYSQRKNDSSIIMIGSGNDNALKNNAWFTLFHPTEKTEGFSNTQGFLHKLLNQLTLESNQNFLTSLILDYVKNCVFAGEYDWKYYYVRYPSFRAMRYGKYTMENDAPYELVALWSAQKESTKAYQCFLKELKESGIDGIGEWVNIREIEYKDGSLKCRNDRFEFYRKDSQHPERFLLIPQNGKRVDTVDRLEYFSQNSNPLQWEEYKSEMVEGDVPTDPQDLLNAVEGKL
ncbi:MAG: DUF262 domain-containing protein [Muribaculaceae bacterium]|nr:DUF262 domain-containing protein [Muribaculaceae bacterium]